MSNNPFHPPSYPSVDNPPPYTSPTAPSYTANPQDPIKAYYVYPAGQPNKNFPSTPTSIFDISSAHAALTSSFGQNYYAQEVAAMKKPNPLYQPDSAVWVVGLEPVKEEAPGGAGRKKSVLGFLGKSKSPASQKRAVVLRRNREDKGEVLNIASSSAPADGSEDGSFPVATVTLPGPLSEKGQPGPAIKFAVSAVPPTPAASSASAPSLLPSILASHPYIATNRFLSNPATWAPSSSPSSRPHGMLLHSYTFALPSGTTYAWRTHPFLDMKQYLLYDTSANLVAGAWHGISMSVKPEGILLVFADVAAVEMIVGSLLVLLAREKSVRSAEVRKHQPLGLELSVANNIGIKTNW